MAAGLYASGELKWRMNQQIRWPDGEMLSYVGWFVFVHIW